MKAHVKRTYVCRYGYLHLPRDSAPLSAQHLGSQWSHRVCALVTVSGTAFWPDPHGALKDHTILHLTPCMQLLSLLSRGEQVTCSGSHRKSAPGLSQSMPSSLCAAHLTPACFVYLDHCWNTSIFMLTVCSIVPLGSCQVCRKSFQNVIRFDFPVLPLWCKSNWDKKLRKGNGCVPVKLNL